MFGQQAEDDGFRQRLIRDPAAALDDRCGGFDRGEKRFFHR